MILMIFMHPTAKVTAKRLFVRTEVSTTVYCTDLQGFYSLTPQGNYPAAT